MKEDIKNRRLAIEDACPTANDHQHWKHIINQAPNPAAPTAVHWLRRRPPLPTNKNNPNNNNII